MEKIKKIIFLSVTYVTRVTSLQDGAFRGYVRLRTYTKSLIAKMR